VLGGRDAFDGPGGLRYVQLSKVGSSSTSVGGGPTDDKPEVTLETPVDPNPVSSFLNIRVADVHAVYTEWSARGAHFLKPPKQHQYEVRCYMHDPDAHLIEGGKPRTRKEIGSPIHGYRASLSEPDAEESFEAMAFDSLSTRRKPGAAVVRGAGTRTCEAQLLRLALKGSRSVPRTGARSRAMARARASAQPEDSGRGCTFTGRGEWTERLTRPSRQHWTWHLASFEIRTSGVLYRICLNTSVAKRQRTRTEVSLLPPSIAEVAGRAQSR
jgi:hypothetical protein